MARKCSRGSGADELSWFREYQLKNSDLSSVKVDDTIARILVPSLSIFAMVRLRVLVIEYSGSHKEPPPPRNAGVRQTELDIGRTPEVQ